MADGLILRAHDKRGALAISPTNIVLVGKHGVFHDSLILRPGVALVLGAFSTGVFNTNALPRINIGADVWGESSIMTGVY